MTEFVLMTIVGALLRFGLNWLMARYGTNASRPDQPAMRYDSTVQDDLIADARQRQESGADRG